MYVIGILCQNLENNKDYSHIFQQISEHQKAIIELIKQLPPEEQKKIKK